MADQPYRVFLSHSGNDKDFVKELYRRLTRDGVSCFFDIESIGWGDHWVRALERALDDCEFVVFVLSPDFCNSEWVEVERTSSIADDPGALKRKVRPLMLRPCRDLPTFPRFLRQVQDIDVSTTQNFEANYPRICRELGGTVRDDTVFTDRTKLPPVGPLPEKHRMPYRSLGDKFVGRLDSLWSLYDCLFRDGTTILAGEAVVVGTGGLGKTQLAIEYAHRFGSVYTGGVYWVDADQGLSTLISQIGEAAGIELNTKTDEANQVQQIWHGLNRFPGPSLIILDNFPENVPLQPYLPIGGRVHTLITTRRQDLDYPLVRLNILTTEEGIRLLDSGARRFGQEAAPLVTRLGGLPLALELAKGYLNYRKKLTIPALLEEMSANTDIELVNEFASQYRDHLPTRHETDIARTFQLSWNAAPELARKILRAMGELAPVAVPRSLLRSALELPGDSSVRDPLGRALDELSRLSLVELDTSGNPIAHRMILAFAAPSRRDRLRISFPRVPGCGSRTNQSGFPDSGCRHYFQTEPAGPSRGLSSCNDSNLSGALLKTRRSTGDSLPSTWPVLGCPPHIPHGPGLRCEHVRARPPLHRHQSIESRARAEGFGAVGGGTRSAAPGVDLR